MANKSLAEPLPISKEKKNHSVNRLKKKFIFQKLKRMRNWKRET